MIATDRRQFLFGALASLAAASAVRPMRALELAAAPSSEWRRIVATFDALDAGNFDIRLGKNDMLDKLSFKWAQIEQGAFPTSYIPTSNGPGYRAPENAFFEIEALYDFCAAKLRDGRIDGITVNRPSPASLWDEDKQEMLTFQPNEPRLSRKGLLLEGTSTNHFLHSDKPRSQQVALNKGQWTFSCWVKGETPRIEIIASDGRAFVPDVRQI